MAYIDFRNVSKIYKTGEVEARALDGVSFSIRKTRTMGLVGESGCGKSTCGRTILRLQEKTAGEVIFDGQDVFALSREQLRTGALRQRLQRLSPERRIHDLQESAQRLRSQMAHLTALRIETESGMVSRLRLEMGHRITRSAEESIYAVTELNFNPSIKIHCYPSAGQSRPIGEAVVRFLFDMDAEVER